MAEKLKSAGEKLEKAAEWILLFLCICIFCGLAYYSARYTVMLNEDSFPVELRDNAGLNLLVLAAVAGLSVLLHVIWQRIPRHPIRQRIAAFQPYLIGIVTVYVYVISAIWVSNCLIMPGGDGTALCSAAHRMTTGNFIDMKEGGYMFIFPHQYGLLSVIYAIFTLFGPLRYEIFQHLNALCMPLLFYSGYKLLQFICKNLKAVFYYVLFFLGCIPLFLYVPYVYGEIISITFTMVLMWQTVRFCQTGKKSCFLWGTAAIILACIVRKNSLIVLVAAGIILLVHSIKKADLRGVVWLLVMALAVSGAGKMIHAFYENKSGLEVSEGVPYVAWIRMGMQENWTGPGWFDNSSIETYAEHGYNTEQAAITEKERLAENLKELWKDKARGIDFLRRKILSQWNSPAYSSLYETQIFDYEKGDLPDFVNRVYYDDRAAVETYMNRYQFVLYSFAAASAILLLADRRKRHCLPELLLFAAIVGGFLFSTFWEACDRYIMPYAVYMIPLAAAGLCRLTQYAGRFLSRTCKYYKC